MVIINKNYYLDDKINSNMVCNHEHTFEYVYTCISVCACVCVHRKTIFMYNLKCQRVVNTRKH